MDKKFAAFVETLAPKASFGRKAMVANLVGAERFRVLRL
jgi:hypothetical protein